MDNLGYEMANVTYNSDRDVITPAAQCMDGIVFDVNSAEERGDEKACEDTGRYDDPFHALLGTVEDTDI